MSKIGRKPIDIQGVAIEVNGQDVSYKGSKGTGIHQLPYELGVHVEGTELIITPVRKNKVSAGAKRKINSLWGLHRAVLSNKIFGVKSGFEKQLQIIGLGYKANLEGSKLVFSLGFSHKIDFPLPAGITVDIDKKTGQLLTVKGIDKELIGLTCSRIRAMRPPEPYKGTGIQYVGEVIMRKAGKTKS